MKLSEISVFTLHLEDPLDGDEASVLVTSIRRQLHCNTLTSLWISQARAPDAEGAVGHGAVSADDIRPLFEFKNLRVFIFTPSGTYKVNDEFYRDMAKAWPHIATLCFGQCSRTLRDPLQATMGALSYFAAYCPQLESVEILFDAASWAQDWSPLSESLDPHMPSVPPELYGALNGKRSTSNLTSLSISTVCPIDRSAEVAMYLMWLFPQFMEMPGCWIDESDGGVQGMKPYELRWSEVAKFVSVPARMRDIGKVVG
ncbi:hypothetical protein C8Q80DRAFT_1117415 [Daedaleopsis nitida]|nr:hypothetical protein C8Q80DRAFT_1117415 [Daedaleopsis nitida]